VCEPEIPCVSMPLGTEVPCAEAAVTVRPSDTFERRHDGYAQREKCMSHAAIRHVNQVERQKSGDRRHRASRSAGGNQGLDDVASTDLA